MAKAIVGGYVVPIDGDPIDGGTVLIDDGKIVAVGTEADVDIPEDAELVDAAGTWVLPGFIDAHAHLGVHEEGEGWSGNDTNEMTDPNGARFRAIDGIDPYEPGFDDALAGGVTSVVIKPGSGNPIGGQTIGVKTWGRSILDMVFAEHVSVKSALGENPKRVYGEKKQTPSTRLGVAAILREAFTKARNYQAKRAHAESEGKPHEVDLTMETLSKVLDGELYWDQHVHRADDIVTALRLADEFGYKLVINHGTEGHLIADLLASRDVPVILGPLFTTKSKVELRNRTLRSARHPGARGRQDRDHDGPPGDPDQLPGLPGGPGGQGRPRPGDGAALADGEPGLDAGPGRPDRLAEAGPGRGRGAVVRRSARCDEPCATRVRPRRRGVSLRRDPGRGRVGRPPLPREPTEFRTARRLPGGSGVSSECSRVTRVIGAVTRVIGAVTREFRLQSRQIRP